MKLFKTLFATALVGAATISGAHAHGDVGWSISIGSPYYVAPPVHYAPPPVVYHYGAPPVYYRAAPPVVYAPHASIGYYGGGHGGWGHNVQPRGHHGKHGRGHRRGHDD